MLDSQLNQGFESGSGFREAFSAPVGAAPSRAQGHRRAAREVAGDAAGLHARDRRRPGPAPSTSSIAAASSALLVLQRCLRARVLPGEHAHLRSIERELAEYFAGTRQSVRNPVALTGSAFQTKVWQALLAIPAGETCSYAELATRIGMPKRCARSRSRQRRQPAVDHRAVPSRDRADGALTGYGGGLAREAEAPRPRAGPVQA